MDIDQDSKGIAIEFDLKIGRNPAALRPLTYRGHTSGQTSGFAAFRPMLIPRSI
jgi:hypothetical protein